MDEHRKRRAKWPQPVRRTHRKHKAPDTDKGKRLRLRRLRRYVVIVKAPYRARRSQRERLV